MKLDDLDKDLNRLHEASERVAANLVELEIDSSRGLLDASALSGESAARWSAASAALTDLWEWRALLDALLQKAAQVRHSSRRADELQALLNGPSIELTRSEVPLAERDLLSSPEIAVHCTPDQLLGQMSRAFDEVKAVVFRFGEAWETLTPRIADARTALARAQTLAASLGEADRRDLAQAAERLEHVGVSLSADPLSIAPADVDRLIESLEAACRELEASAALRGELDARLADASAQLASLRAAVEEGRSAHEELLVKISVPSAPPAPELPEALGSELEEIAGLGRSGTWRDARRRLDRWTERTAALLEDAQRVVRANRAPIEARNQLRALLEAYQVKARRVGAVEDPELERIFAEAQQVLYRAPTDLSLAAQLVRRYQEHVTAAHAAPEVAR